MTTHTSGFLLVFLLLATRTATAQEARLDQCLENLGASNKAEFLGFDRELRAALLKEDSVSMTVLVKYPLRVNEDGGTISIEDPAALQTRFQDLFPPPVRSAVVSQKPEELICRSDGIGYANGSIWVNVVRQGKLPRYVITSVNPPTTGTPKTAGMEFVCRAENHRVVIDADTTGKVRYRSWNRPRALTDKPDLELPSGTSDFMGRGACAYRIWSFRSGVTEYTVEELGCFPNSNRPPTGATGELSVAIGGVRKSVWWCY